MIHVDLRQFFLQPIPTEKKSFIDKRRVDTPQDVDGEPDFPSTTTTGEQ